MEKCAIEDFIVASFGTGQTTRPIPIEDAREWGAIEWAVPIIDVLFDGAADAADYVASQLIPEAQYFRFQTILDKAYDDMDRADQTNLNALRNVANHFLREEGGEKRIDELSKLLQRRRRQGLRRKREA
jgi:hypothetical protein